MEDKVAVSMFGSEFQCFRSELKPDFLGLDLLHTFRNFPPSFPLANQRDIPILEETKHFSLESKWLPWTKFCRGFQIFPLLKEGDKPSIVSCGDVH